MNGGDYVSTWTGTELLVYRLSVGEESSGTVAAAYNPTTGRWRVLPSSPYPVRNVEGGYFAVWDGTEMLTWGMMNAAYNPTTNRWRALGEPKTQAPAVVVWTGRQVLAWGGGCCGAFGAEGVAYDPVRDSWQAMPLGPLAGRSGAYGSWTGKELLVIGGGDNDTEFTDGAAYNPTTRTWRSLPPMPQVRARASAVWTGTELLLAGGDNASWPNLRMFADGLAFNPSTSRWRTLPSSGIACSGEAVWTGSLLLVWGGRSLPRDMTTGEYSTPPHGVIYNPATNAWSAMPVSVLRGRTGAAMVWTGAEMLVWGGMAVKEPRDYLTDGASFVPGS